MNIFIFRWWLIYFGGRWGLAKGICRVYTVVSQNHKLQVQDFSYIQLTEDKCLLCPK